MRLSLFTLQRLSKVLLLLAMIIGPNEVRMMAMAFQPLSPKIHSSMCNRCTTMKTPGASWNINTNRHFLEQPRRKGQRRPTMASSLFASAGDSDADADANVDSKVSESSSSSSSSPSANQLRFLGRGSHAIVRPGVVLVAPPDEFHHFLRRSAVFIYAMGEDENDVYVIRGVILDHPTPFTMEEMMPGGQAILDGSTTAVSEEKENSETSSTNQQQTPMKQVLQNLLYRGGELGDAVFMLHSDKQLGEEAGQEMIGTSGIYQGGLDYLLEHEEEEDTAMIEPQQAKFFWSYMEFTEAELDEMLGNREDDSTQWVSVEVPPEFIVYSEWERGEAWSRLRNAVREM